MKEYWVNVYEDRVGEYYGVNHSTRHSAINVLKNSLVIDSSWYPKYRIHVKMKEPKIHPLMRNYGLPLRDNWMEN